jgi:hypothetical protein
VAAEEPVSWQRFVEHAFRKRPVPIRTWTVYTTPRLGVASILPMQRRVFTLYLFRETPESTPVQRAA